MKSSKIIAAMLVLLPAAGCVQNRAIDPAIAAAAKEPLICTSEAQCELYWHRAQFWVSSNSSYKVQTVTDTIIETYSPRGGDPSLGYQIKRERFGNGQSRIWIHAGCDNMFGCQPRVEVAAADFKSYVRKTTNSKIQ
jgi:hypothetical protein